MTRRLLATPLAAWERDGLPLRQTGMGGAIVAALEAEACANTRRRSRIIASGCG